MFIEINGVGFTNKGGELMMLAILQRLAPEFPEARFIVSPRGDDNDKRLNLGLYPQTWFAGGRVMARRINKMTPSWFLRKRYKVIREKADALLDASGFAYSEQWGSDNTLSMADRSRKLKERGAKVILLPQAFGPFSSEKIREGFKALAECSDLIFPRDDVSYDHVVDLVGESPRIIKTPDFTIGVEGVQPESFPGGRIAIVPNYRMVDKTSEEKSRRYIPFFAMCIRELISHGEDPFFLIHEGPADVRLAEEINATLDLELDIHKEDDPLKLKGIIGTCRGMIGSRFHGLVSALSQGVPALALGWSHKYEMLFKDFDFPEGMLSLDSTEEGISQSLEVFLDGPHRTAVCRKIGSARAGNLVKIDKMWDLVIRTIRSEA